MPCMKAPLCGLMASPPALLNGPTASERAVHDSSHPVAEGAAAPRTFPPPNQ